MRLKTVSACAHPIIAGVLLASALSGCTAPATPTGHAAADRNNDPLEPLNRRVLQVNQFADRLLFKPMAKGYVAAVPGDARLMVRHVLNNMKEPTLFINNVLQGEFDRAWTTAGRFAINTSLGFGGLFDVADTWGLARQPADFGQTLYAWGVPSGPYLVLPILGPSNPRDAIGGMVDSYADPGTILGNANNVQELMTARFITDGTDKRAEHLAELDDLEKNSLDFYAELRSMSQQHRESELHNGAPIGLPGPEFYREAGLEINPAPAKPAASAAPKPPASASVRSEPTARPQPAAPRPPSRPAAAAPVQSEAARVALPPPLQWTADDPEEGPLLPSR
ncbi:MAG TPA: VacJ family lipoprotein [Stellaceae bacterium]|nr:VacJ family lipoprotein [Stellaceae bacterium]